MKSLSSNFYTLSVYFLVFMFSLSTYAQEKDTVIVVKHDTVYVSPPSCVMVDFPKMSKYDRRVHRYRTRWESLIPTHSTLQYAGNMGFLSFGIGWDYGKRTQWETDAMFGFLPRFSSGRPKMTFTLKESYMPWSFALGKQFYVEPLSCGVYANTIFGDEFWTEQPDRYPNGYYDIPTKVRAHIFVGQRFTYDANDKVCFCVKKVTFFYEISVSDLHLFSAISNEYLKPKDYLSLSFGVKFQWF